MNSEQFSSALDGISDDLIDAAAGAYERKNDKKKWFVRGLCVACIGLLLVVVGLIRNLPAGTADPSQPTISMENPTTVPITQPTETTAPTDQIGEKIEGTRVFYLSTMGGTETPLKSGIATPIEYIVYYRDLRGLSDEECEEATAQWHAFETELLSGAGEYSHTSYAANDLIICTYIKGFLGITSSRGNISDLYVSTNTRVGNYSWGMVGDAYYVDWYLNHEVLIEDPDMPLSSIRDSLEVTITYEDSTTECIVIDITIDDEGQVYATLAEAPTAA
jgi:hypothetical protein